MKNEFITNIPDYEGIGVYALVNNRNGKMYIGSSQNIRQRIIHHKYSPPSTVKEDIYQGDTFSVKILEKLPYGCNQFDMFNRESHYIQYYDALKKGYNRAKTTCHTKEELLTSLEYFKNNKEMSEYIENIVSKRERPIYAKHKTKNAIQRIPIEPTLFSAIKTAADAAGEKVNEYIKNAIKQRMERDSAK